jgi:GMP synthase-like glutamine amidotransferase
MLSVRSPDTILIGSNHPLDKGGAFPRALEARGIDFDVVDLKKRFPQPQKIGGIIALGSPEVNGKAQIAWYKDLIKVGTPGIGVCVSHQGMGEALGGATTSASSPEFGFYRPFLTEEGKYDPVVGSVFTEHPNGVVFEFHSDQVKVNPDTTIVIARGDGDTVQALRSRNTDGTPGRMLGVQFHPELTQRDDLETFLAIYNEIFCLTAEANNTLRDHYTQYQELNVGSLIVDRLIDDMVGSTSEIAA